MLNEKKKYLKQYLLQETRILRLKEMIPLNPLSEDTYKAEILKSRRLRDEIESKINSTPDKLLCEILYQKYVLGKTLEEISYILNYSKRHTERLHIKALENFEI